MKRKYNDNSFTQNNVNQKMWFKDGDFKNHMFNEKNIPITTNFVNSVFRKYGVEYDVQNLQNFQTAMTHVSYIYKTNVKDKTAKLLKGIPPIESEYRDKAMKLQPRDYNIFEFGGDAIIDFIVAEYLYSRYKGADSGFLTNLKSKITKDVTLSFLSKRVGLDKYAVIGRNKELNNDREKDIKLTEDIFESFMRAMRLETTLENCKKFLVSVIESEIDFADLIAKDENYKDKLMHYFQKKYKDQKNKEPKYIKAEVRKIPNVNCNEQEIVVHVLHPEDNSVIGIGVANKRNKAEQIAAYNAAIDLNIIDNSDGDDEFFGEEICNNKKSDEKKEDKTEESELLLWFKDKDFKDFILNEKNLKIDRSFINNIFNRYDMNHTMVNKKIYQKGMIHISYLDKSVLTEKTAGLLRGVDPIDPKYKKKKIFPLQQIDNSRECFLGNSIIRSVLAEYLCDRYGTKDQGFLTKLRNKIVRADTISKVTSKLELNKYAIIARNKEQDGSRYTDNSLMKGLFDSFIAALYLETSYEECKDFLISIFEENLDFAELINKEDNYKEKLMHYFQKKSWSDPIYEDINENSDEDKPIIGKKEHKFIINILDNNGNIIGMGSAINDKTKAQQNAAYDALIKIGLIIDSDNDSDYYGEISDNDLESSDSEYFEE